ncbi:MAG TPA: nitronate monooxygenase [Methylibium sp.]|nr:nitronate monooxygenase [Methylibium sp.]
MRLKTRLTETLGIRHPVLLAPMGVIAGGRLAAAVSEAGGLGIIGGGYGDADWLEQQFAAAGRARVGCGFITWSMAKSPQLLDQVLARQPAALMLSFGAVEPHAARIKAQGVPLICQVQGMSYLREAVDAGADIIVAEGCEAGGHSGHRGLFTLVPEAADYLAQHAPDTVLVAAGGVGDGRGLAAALMLGADGVLVGTRFIACQESEAPDGFRQAIVGADGDATLKSNSVDVVRKRYWPNPEFVVRVLRNRFVSQWHGREREIEQAIEVEHERFWNAFKAGDAENSGVLMGEASGLIHDAPPAAQIVERMVAQACALLGPRSPHVVGAGRGEGA